MVQTATQYVFVHEVLAEVLSSRDTYISQHDLQHGSDWMPNPQGGRLPDAVRDKFVAQFQTEPLLCPTKGNEAKFGSLTVRNIVWKEDY
nr:hypothetical protein BaRGS_002021 [Batillaria attramentaria]